VVKSDEQICNKIMVQFLIYFKFLDTTQSSIDDIHTIMHWDDYFLKSSI
jgi:hypothetical protein